MSELRFDPIKKTWVIVASERGRRPSQYEGSGAAHEEPEGCPFCVGNEGMTPPEVFAVRKDRSDPDGPGWTVRVVPNKYPALSPDLPYEPYVEGIQSRIPGFGIHEILIETPVRNRQMVDMDREELGEVLLVLRDRLAAHLSDGRFRAVIGFKNHGKDAGASLVHSHCQIMALPVVPNHLAALLESFTEHRERTGNCLYCEIVESEKVKGERVIEDSGDFAALAPFAAASPFQVRIVPTIHSHSFTQLNEEGTSELAVILGSVLRRLRHVLGEHPWNMVFYTAPAETAGGEDSNSNGNSNREFHWFLEITPRLTNLAGFEMGSGFLINTVSPEECAELLRAVSSV